MVRRCYVKSCGREWLPNSTVSFHRFPLRNPELQKEWLRAIPGSHKKPITRYHYICSLHFSEDLFSPSTYKQRRLKDVAVPNVFTEIIDSCIEVLDPSMHNESNTAQDPHYNIAMESDIDSRVVSAEQESQAHSLDSSNDARSVEFRDVAVQTSPRRLKPSDREQELQRRIRILQQRLKRREVKLTTFRQMVEYLKSKQICTSNLEEVLMEHQTPTKQKDTNAILTL